MENLISGKEAKLAWANNENVEYTSDELSQWYALCASNILGTFDRSDFKFRLKPRTITINGIEVPAPFEPKVGEIYFIIHPGFKHGYTSNAFTDTERHRDFIKYGAWRTLGEIKQVVAALRTVFKGATQ